MRKKNLSVVVAKFKGGLIKLVQFGLAVTLAVQTASAAEKFTLGVDYFAIETKQSSIVGNANLELDALPQVADIEIFYWYGCQACYGVEQALQSYLAERPELSYKRTPLVAYASWRPQAYIQPMMEQLQGIIRLPDTEKIYQQCLSDCRVFSSYEKSREWLFDYAETLERPVLNEALIWQAEKEYRNRADILSISQVPTIIIRESYRVDANSAKSIDRMMRILEYLLKQ